jgi:hypothetical protein
LLKGKVYGLYLVTPSSKPLPLRLLGLALLVLQRLSIWLLRVAAVVVVKLVLEVVVVLVGLGLERAYL